MKRKLGFVALMTLLFTLLFAASAQAACSHPTYKYVVGKSATCCEAGYKNLVCSKCGWVKKAQASTIAATGNHLRTRNLVTKPATCSATGVMKTYCAFTGKVIKTTTLAKVAHTMKTTCKPATCTAAGKVTHTCTKCGTVKTETLSALGHSLKIAASKSATCAASGYRQYACTRCAYTRKTTIAATGLHKMELKSVRRAVNPCLDDWTETYECKICKARDMIIREEAKGHGLPNLVAYGTYDPDAPAGSSTCYYEEVCPDCGMVLKSYNPALTTGMKKPSVTYPYGKDTDYNP